jgi:hypothetical protein
VIDEEFDTPSSEADAPDSHRRLAADALALAERLHVMVEDGFGDSDVATTLTILSELQERSLAVTAAEPDAIRALARVPEPQRSYGIGMAEIVIPDGWLVKQRDISPECIIHAADRADWMEVGLDYGGRWWYRVYHHGPDAAAGRRKVEADSALDAFTQAYTALTGEAP